jgi:phenylacetate-CoA ligase
MGRPELHGKHAHAAVGEPVAIEPIVMTRSTATSVAVLDRLPVLTKDELLERQANDPPFAGLVASDFHPRRVFQWPSPLYDAEPDGKDPWRWRPALESAGFGRSDVVLNAFAYHLTPAGAMFEEGPAGSWAPQCFPGGGQHRRPGAGVCSPGRHRLRPPPVVSQGLARGGRRAAGVRRLVDTVRLRDGRTAARVPAAWLLERLDVVLEGYGTAESGNLGYECSHMAGWHVPADALVRIPDEGDEGNNSRTYTISISPT